MSNIRLNAAAYDWSLKEIAVHRNHELGYTAAFPVKRWDMDDITFAGYGARYATITKFHATLMEMYRHALDNGDDVLLCILEGNLPDALRAIQRRLLNSNNFELTPKFFRTDEAAPGKIIEVQCPGSMWGEYALLEKFFIDYLGLDESRRFKSSIVERFSESVRTIVDEPVLHHLIDNASIPHTMRYFIERTRSEGGLRYWGYDSGIKIRDCNFIRSHSYFGLMSENLFLSRLKGALKSQVHFDYPPISTFDQKAILALPFHPVYRSWFEDEVRDIFPPTYIIEGDKIVLGQDIHEDVATFMKRSKSQRAYFVKYAGVDTSRNWGSMAVVNTRKQSKPQLERLFGRILSDFKRNDFWIIQPMLNETQEMSGYSAEGPTTDVDGHLKYSGFYGPNGILGVAVMHRVFHKVHGASDTVITLV